jgi:tetratricopeptide (TPR) repeat protein
LRKRQSFPAGGKLILAEAQYVNVEIIFFDRRPAIPVDQHIAAARALDPELPEADVAEYLIAPISAFDERLRLIERASARHPDNPDLLAIRAEFLLTVGRLNEAVDAARQAYELDPLTPGLGNNLIQTLATPAGPKWRRRNSNAPSNQAGHADASRCAFSLSPSIRRSARSAPIMRSEGISREFEEFLVARIDPTPANIERAVKAVRRREQPAPRPSTTSFPTARPIRARGRCL